MLMKTVSVGCGTTMIAFGTGLIFAPEQELKCIRTPTGFLTTLCHSLPIMAELSLAAQSKPLEVTEAVLREIAKNLRSKALRKKYGSGSDWADFFDGMADHAANLDNNATELDNTSQPS